MCTCTKSCMLLMHVPSMVCLSYVIPPHADKVVLKPGTVSVRSKLSVNGRLFLLPISTAETRKVVCATLTAIKNVPMLMYGQPLSCTA